MKTVFVSEKWAELMSLTVSRLSPWVPHWCRRSGCSHAQCSPDMRKTCPSLWPAPPSNRQVESVAPTRSPLVATNQHTQILAVQQVCMQCMFNGLCYYCVTVWRIWLNYMNNDYHGHWPAGRAGPGAGAVDSYDYKFESRQFEIGKQTY